VIEVSGVREGMDVYDSAGDKIGAVVGVQTTMMGGSGLDTGKVTDVDAGTTPNTYVEVTNGHRYWFPVNQILRLDDNGVHVACDGAGCRERYTLRPPGLDEGTPPPRDGLH
jgi:hypothetical protein